MSYASDIELGEKYRDEQTGMEGIAIAVTFFQFGCERVTLEWVDGNKIEEATFDAPRLINASTGEQARTEDRGGPMRGSSHVRPGPARR